MCMSKCKIIQCMRRTVLSQPYCASDNGSNITSGRKRKNIIDCYNKNPNTKINC